MKCEFCEEDAVPAFGVAPNENMHLCQGHISESLSVYYQNVKR